MSYAQLLDLSPLLTYGGLAVLGLLVGSFLNVVILRLPVILHRQWRRDCQELLAADGSASDCPDRRQESEVSEANGAATAPLSLAQPGSHCPACLAPIRPWHNIPILSYLILRGRCANCGRAIGWRYPLVEALGAAIAIGAALCASDWLELGAMLGVGWSLLALAGIDIDEQLLPDDITQPLLWAGLLFHLFTERIPLADAVMGAVLGYLLLWSVYWLFKIVTGKEGMGFGDFKLLAALGAWLGWQTLPLIILLSAGTGAIIGIAMIIVLRRDRGQPLPFGPYLAIAGWIAMLWGDQINAAYLAGAGL